MWKLYLFLFIALIGSQSSAAQFSKISTESSDETNIYFLILKDYFNASQMALFSKNAFIAPAVYSMTDTNKIRWMDDDEILRKARKGKFELIALSPIKIDLLGFNYVELIHYYVSYRNKTLRYENIGGEKIKFQFDCETKKYIIQSGL